MIISKRCVHGILAAIYIASQPVKEGSIREYIQIAVIADKLKISFHFLTKVLQQLTHKGILASYRGPNGGVLLARSVDQVTLYDLIEAIDGDQIFTTCMLGLPGCGTEKPCPVHDSWVGARTKFKSIASTTTLRILAENADALTQRMASAFVDMKMPGVTEEEQPDSCSIKTSQLSSLQIASGGML
jgi:Rrf2 family transcriptional regulator, iron-sulfur cluster assembly transcription factor